MKRIFYYILLGIILTANSLYGIQYEWCHNFYAFVEIYDPDGNPVSGVQVKLYASLYGEEEAESSTVYGYTAGDGTVTLSTSACIYEPITSHYMQVDITNDSYNIISSSNTSSWVSTLLYPEFEVLFDADRDFIDDNLENIIAEKFKPILHKHSLDYQQDLANFDDVLNNHMNLYGYNYQGQEEYSGDVPPIHVWMGTGDRCSFGSGDLVTYWNLKLKNRGAIGHTGASAGNRPLYYHVYDQENYYYIQYWYYFNMNDLTNQTLNETWHEGDWEHVSIKLQEVSCSSGLADWETSAGYVKYDPISINFYRHLGGRTSTANNCWWSSNNNTSYSGIQQGYDDYNTHLHIWIARNSHASFNRYHLVYHMQVDTWIGSGSMPFHLLDAFTDNVDYDPSGYDLYFGYDYLEKMGYVKFETFCQRHGFTWFHHYDPVGSSKEWLAFDGRMGAYWSNGFTSTPSPECPGIQPAWLNFPVDYSTEGFGNEEGGFFLLVNHSVEYWNDSPLGD